VVECLGVPGIRVLTGFRRDFFRRRSVPDRASVRYVGRVCGVREGGNRVPKRLLPGAAFNFRDSPRVVYASRRAPAEGPSDDLGAGQPLSSPSTKRLSMRMRHAQRSRQAPRPGAQSRSALALAPVAPPRRATPESAAPAAELSQLSTSSSSAASSVTHSATRSATRSAARLASHSATRSATRSASRSVTRSVSRSATRSATHSRRRARRRAQRRTH
jgi:hypothetical protein